MPLLTEKKNKKKKTKKKRTTETIHLRLGLEPMCWDSNLVKSQIGTSTRWFFFFCLLGPHPPHIRVQSELQLLAYARATAMQDPSHICSLHNTSWQCWILNPLSEAREQTRILMDASQVH